MIAHNDVFIHPFQFQCQPRLLKLPTNHRVGDSAPRIRFYVEAMMLALRHLRDREAASRKPKTASRRTTKLSNAP